MEMQIHTLLPHNYEFEVLQEIPSPASVPILYYPNGTWSGGRDGIIIKVTPHQGSPWIGIFAFWTYYLNGIYTCAREDQICVIINGHGFLVNTLTPSAWSEVSLLPILEAFQAPKLNLIVMHSFTHVAALGRDRNWRAEVAGDDLEITERTDTVLTGTGTDYGGTKIVKFRLSLEDGQVQYLK